MKIFSLFRIFRPQKRKLTLKQMIDAIASLKKSIEYLDHVISQIENERQTFLDAESSTGGNRDFKFIKEISTCEKHLRRLNEQKEKALRKISDFEVMTEVRGNVISENIGIT